MDTIDFLLHDVHTMILFSCLKCVAVMSLCHSCYLNVFFLFIKKGMDSNCVSMTCYDQTFIKNLYVTRNRC